jgi:hypothetical protein
MTEQTNGSTNSRRRSNDTRVILIEWRQRRMSKNGALLESKEQKSKAPLEHTNYMY